MEEALAMRALEQVFGAFLMLAVLLDVFLTVLYARVGTGILSHKLARLTWRLFRLLPAGRYRPTVLSFCGPAILVLLVLTWSVLLAVGAGLIIHPELSTGVRASSGETPTDFVRRSTWVAAVSRSSGQATSRRIRRP